MEPERITGRIQLSDSSWSSSGAKMQALKVMVEANLAETRSQVRQMAQLEESVNKEMYEMKQQVNEVKREMVKMKQQVNEVKRETVKMNKGFSQMKELMSLLINQKPPQKNITTLQMMEEQEQVLRPYFNDIQSRSRSRNNLINSNPKTHTPKDIKQRFLRMIRHGEKSVFEVARQAKVQERTVFRWLKQF